MYCSCTVDTIPLVQNTNTIKAFIFCLFLTLIEFKINYYRKTISSKVQLLQPLRTAFVFFCLHLISLVLFSLTSLQYLFCKPLENLFCHVLMTISDYKSFISIVAVIPGHLEYNWWRKEGTSLIIFNKCFFPIEIKLGQQFR